MKDSIIEELLNEAASRAENCRPNTEEYDKESLAKGELAEGLTKCLSPEQRKMFEDYVELEYKVASAEIDEAYRQGFSLGVRLTAEAFLIGEK